MSNDDYICDEEKSYNEWVVNNLYYIRDNKDCIRVMKKLYMDGFAAGFVYKQHMIADEQLQK
jgi:hypothetical protein